MAYTTIDNPELYFQTKLYVQNASTNAITLDGSENMQPDWVWIKNRDSSNRDHRIFDSVRGANKPFKVNGTNAEATATDTLNSFDSDGFTLGADSEGYGVNDLNTNNTVAWCWKAGGSAPTITYSVKVVSDSGNKYRFDDFGTSAVTLDLQEGGTYTFDQSDSSNSGHPLRFSTTSNGTHGGGSEYTTGITTTGTPGSAGAKTVITVAASAPTLYYYCTQHSGMGGQANTNSTFGSSNFSGSIQSTVSVNATAGFSIVKYTGNKTAGATVGHGLGVAPKMIILKALGQTFDWNVGHNSLGWTKTLFLNDTSASASNAYFNNTAPTTTVFSLNSDNRVNNSSEDYIAYCFTEKQGYSKFGSYIGNGNADGTFVYTGFKPAWVMVKSSTSTEHWLMYDNKRKVFNANDEVIYANLANAEDTNSGLQIDLLSNGFKLRGASANLNNSGQTFIFMAFAESPFVNSNGVPTNAR